MKKYKVYLTQYVEAQFQVELEIESDKNIEELEDEIRQEVEDWNRLARFHPDTKDFPGTYIPDSYSYNLDYQGDDGDEVQVYIEESKD